MEMKIENINDENITFNLDKIKFNKISDINLINYKGKVYDLEIVDEPNYLSQVGFVHNGGGKRKGSFAVYISPHHADIFDFLDLRKNNGKEELRCRDLNLALWVPDLFFKKVENDEDFYLMDPNVCKFLEDTYDETPEGGSFTNLYNKYVSEGKFVRKIKARELWSAMITSQIETGQPYVLAKDACNRKSNQNNLGTIKSSNLCVSGNTQVTIESKGHVSQVSMKELNDLVNKTTGEFKIQSYCSDQNEVVFSEILNVGLTNLEAEVIKLTIDDKELILTPEHKVFTKNRGYVEAQLLTEEDELLLVEQG
jgi:ribonucleotide reductase alpha subunit